MQQSHPQRLTDEKIKRALVSLAVIMFALVAGWFAGSTPDVTTAVIVGTTILVWWAVVARGRWWLPMLFAITFGGYFQWGFKFYPNEAAMTICFLPLIAMLALHFPGIRQHRTTTLPISFFLLGGYMIAHWLGSNMYNHANGMEGMGNVTRVYMNALWVVLFVAVFQRYGSTKFIGTALVLIYVAAFLRVGIGLFSYNTGFVGIIPVINYALPGSTHEGGDDLRSSAFALASVAMCYFLMQKGLGRKTFHLLVFLGSGVVLLFGAGRMNLFLMAMMPAAVALLYRKIVPLAATLCVVGAVILFINATPESLEHLPSRVRRTASIFLFNPDLAEKYGEAGSSDIWHQRMREIGYEKWTASWSSFFFGTGIRPYDEASSKSFYGYTGIEPMLEASTKVGAYESGWWTVTAVTGLIGLLLYLNIMRHLLWRLVPEMLRHGVSSPSHAFAFLSFFGLGTWLCLGWTFGGFPSVEIMFGFLAVFAFDDAREKKVVEQGATKAAPMVLGSAVQLVRPHMR